jgi:DNA-binding transcriptional MerR regulator
MRISELSRQSGVPLSTIKFYIRSGLLPSGELSHPNQARYGPAHLSRLQLIRALREVAGLPLEVVRDVLEQTERPWGEADPVGAALEVIYRPPERQQSDEEQAAYEKVRAEVEALLRDLPWVREETPAAAGHLTRNVDAVADAVMQLRRYVLPDFKLESVRAFATAAWLVSEAVLLGSEHLVPRPGDDLVAPARSAILGTLLIEPLVLALLRMANAMRSDRISEGLPLPHPHLADVEDSAG